MCTVNTCRQTYGCRIRTGTKSWDFTCCYPEELERAKLRFITDQFRDFGLGAAPGPLSRSHAASTDGEHPVSKATVAETSVTPKIRYGNEFGAEL